MQEHHKWKVRCKKREDLWETMSVLLLPSDTSRCPVELLIDITGTTSGEQAKIIKLLNGREAALSG
jgi:hypothetical protein